MRSKMIHKTDFYIFACSPQFKWSQFFVAVEQVRIREILIAVDFLVYYRFVAIHIIQCAAKKSHLFRIWISYLIFFLLVGLLNESIQRIQWAGRLLFHRETVGLCAGQWTKSNWNHNLFVRKRQAYDVVMKMLNCADGWLCGSMLSRLCNSEPVSLLKLRLCSAYTSFTLVCTGTA